MRPALSRAAAAVARTSRSTWAWMRAHPVLAVCALPALALAYVLVLLPLTPSVADIREARTEQPSVLMSADGKELASFRRANREWIKLADISPDVVKALIATEDHRFYEHHGIDVQRTFSAVLHTLGGSTQGGSTITQQLARNFYPDQIGRAISINRKLKEAITALKIEAAYSKDEILETYLNTVPFLYNAWGIEMAARTYFDRSADRLDVLQSATLIGMLKGTTYYNPVLNPERAEQRRNIVLSQMVKRGQLDASRLEVLKAKPLGLNFEQQTEANGAAPHLSRFLKRWLIEWADRGGYNIYADGLVVRTTIDARLQNLAVQAVERQTERLQATADAMWAVPKNLRTQRANVWRTLVRETAEFRKSREMGLDEESAFKQLLGDAAFVRRLREEKMQLAAGFVALEPGSGQVRAWVGSRDFAQDQFDHVVQARRQPGSTFKPFVYGAAFEAGLKPWDVFMDEAVEIAVDNGSVWRPTDGGGPSGQPMSLRDGLAYSKNTITAQVMQKVGPANVANLARALGVRNSKLDEVLSLGLGTSPVTLKEMVAAYGSIANNGAYIEPVLVTRVEDRHGKVLEQFAVKAAEPGMSPESALQLVDALRGAVNRGTGTAIRARFGIEADVAGKTGTTQDNTDAWFILMHPQLVGGAWVGFNDNRVTMGSDWGQGARGALPIVGDFFQHALRAKAIDAQVRFATPPADPAPALQPSEPLPGMPVAPATQPEGSSPPIPAEQQVTTETAPVFGGVRRVDRVERAAVGVSSFPPLPERRGEAAAATIIAPAPVQAVAQPLPAPEPTVVTSPVAAPTRLEPRPVTQILSVPPQPQRQATPMQELLRTPMPEPIQR